MDRIAACINNGTDNQIDHILQAAGRAALEAGGIIRRLYGQPHQIRHKGMIDIVTEADLASEQAIIEMLGQELPGIAVMAEESKAEYSTSISGATWIIDPLDGTTNFAHGFPYFGVSIGYALDGVPLAGVIYCPMQDELFCACRGKGAWLNGSKITISSVADLQHSLVATGFPYDVHGTLPQVIDTLRRVLPKVQDIRRAGAAALDLAYVACGRLDGFWEMNLKPWDTAVGAVLVEEAGGKLSDFSGGPFSLFKPEAVASNGLIHKQLVELM
jgi:myo-inositol-1(or 4)-monophosphatase